MSIAHAILGVLIEGEKHGYQIAADLAERIPTGPYNSGQVHQALARISSAGWATSRSEPGTNRARRPFAITAAGRKEFLRWLPRPVAGARPMRDEMLVKVVFLGRHDPARLVVLLEGRRREHVRRLAYLQRESRASHEPAGVGALGQLARDAARFREEAELRWVEHCLARLGPAPPVAMPDVESRAHRG
jgi:DNA-binding PadR family transcriptional regulator